MPVILGGSNGQVYSLGKNKKFLVQVFDTNLATKGVIEKHRQYLDSYHKTLNMQPVPEGGWNSLKNRKKKK